MLFQEHYNAKIQCKTDPELAQDGYMQELRLFSIFQKAKSEHNCKMTRFPINIPYK